MRKNRILGVLLSVVMLVGMIPSTIFADNSTLPKSNKLDSAEKMAAAMPSLPSAVFTKSGKSNRLVIRTDSDISAYLQGAETLTYQDMTIAVFDTVDEADTALTSIKKLSGVKADMDRPFMICDDEEKSEQPDTEAVSDTRKEEQQEETKAETKHLSRTEKKDSQENDETSVSAVSDSAVSEASSSSEEPVEEDQDEKTLKEQAQEKKKTLVALIDTGSDTADESVNLTSYSEKDKNGHGTKMTQNITSAADDSAMILSIKAVGDDGEGSLSDIYAAVQYAMDQQADMIVLPVSSDNPEADTLEDLLTEEVDNGITVVAAAGNGNKDTAETFPGKMESIYVAGACSSDGTKTEDSNYGDTVDYYIPAASTSEAASILAGYLSACKQDGAQMAQYCAAGKAFVSLKEEKEEEKQEDLQEETEQQDQKENAKEEEKAADAPSTRILFATEDPSIIRKEDTITGSYNGMYLIQYETKAAAKEAYLYYSEKADFADYDTEIAAAADSDAIETPSESGNTMTQEENPLTELSDALDDNTDDLKTSKKEVLVALIDSGAPKDDAHVVEAVSMTGEDPEDENGHGTTMANDIEEQAPDAKILSIKALGKDGKGDISAVYAAIQYAIEKKADIINLSLSTISTENNAILTEAVKAASDAGITVVGSAGNNGKNVKYYTPGNIEEAVIIGACDENGKRLEDSNYGDTVDYNVIAGSTSEAAAKFSGAIASLIGNGKDWKESITVNDGSLVFTTDYVKEEDKKDDTQPDDGDDAGNTVNADASSPSITAATHIGNEGWKFWDVPDNGGWAGHTYGDSQYIQAVSFRLNKGGLEAIDGGVQYQGHLSAGTWASQNGRAGDWEAWKTGFDCWTNKYGQNEANYAGTVDDARPLEAMKLQLTGTFAKLFTIRYSLGGHDNCTNTVNSKKPWNYTGRTGGDGFYWSEGANGSQAGTTGHKRRNTYLSVKLEPNGYTLSFNANGGSGGQGDLSVWSGLTNNNGRVSTPSRTGYTFQGYYTSGGTQIYNSSGYRNDDGGIWYNGLWGHPGDVTLYAHWTANSYSLTIDPNDGYWDGDVPTTPTYTVTYDSTDHYIHDDVTSSVKKDGYFLDGIWSGKTDGSQLYGNDGYAVEGTYWTGDKEKKWKYTDNVTAYPHWKYTLHFDPNTVIDRYGNKVDSTGSMNDQTLTYKKSTALTANAFARSGYQFTGWNTKEDGTGVAISDTQALTSNPLDTTGRSTITLYAQWELISYTITYNNCDGAANTNPAGYAPYFGEFTLKDPSKTNSKFLGWTGEGVTTPTKSLTVPASMMDHNLTFTANWKDMDPYSFVDASTGKNPILSEKDTDKGKFKIVEIQSSPGYINTYQEQEVTIPDDVQNGVISVSFDNYPNEYQIKKVNGNTNQPLAGATFKIWHVADDGTTDVTLDPQTTGEDGIISLKGLKPGTWHYQETKAPIGYSLDQTIYTIKVDTDGNITGSAMRIIKNLPYDNPNQIILSKQDSDGNPIAGAVFSIIAPNGTTQSLTTDEDGYITIWDPQEGTYTYMETFVPSPYVNDGVSDSFTVSNDGRLPNGGYIVTAVNQTNRLVLKKVDAETNDVLPGVTFKLWQDGDEANAVTKTTDASGLAEFTRLATGTWHYQETATAQGYIYDDTVYTVTVDENRKIDGEAEKTITVSNKQNQFKIRKVDQDGKVFAGVSFRIYSDNGYDETKVTDSNGEIVLKGLRPGTYTYVEIPKSGYAADTKTRTFTVASDGKITPSESEVIVNTKNSLMFKKADVDGNPVAGVVFKFTYSGSGENPFVADGTYTTPENGVLRFDTLPAGDYTVTEVSVPDVKYIKDTETHKFTVTSSGTLTTDDASLNVEGRDSAGMTLTMTNQTYPKMSLKLTKKDSSSGEALSGAEFTLYEWDGTEYTKLGMLTPSADETGTYVYPVLQTTEKDEGKFKIIETKVPDGYTGAYEKEFSVDQTQTDQTIKVELNAENKPNQVTIIKNDENGNAMNGITFRIWKTGDETNALTKVTGTDGEMEGDGKIVLKKLAAGTWNYQETATKEGYRLDKTTHQFTVAKDGTINNAAETVLDPVVNYPVVPKEIQVKLAKQDKNGTSLSGAAFMLQEWDKEKSAYQDLCPLEEDIENKVYTNKIKAYTSESNLGKFRIVETTSPAGYLKGYVKEFTASDDNELSETFTFTAINAENELRIKKTDQDGNALAGTTFTLTDNKTGEIVSTQQSGTDGIIHFTKIVPGEYTLAETVSPDGYRRLTDTYTVTVQEDGKLYVGTDASKASGLITLDITNHQNKLVIWKTDRDNNPLQGVEFKIWMEGEEDHAVTKTTGSDGKITMTALKPGIWKFQETKGVDGMDFTDQIYSVTVNEDSSLTVNDANQNLTSYTYQVMNGPMPTGSVKVKKVSATTGKDLSDTKFGIMDFNPETGDYALEQTVTQTTSENDANGPAMEPVLLTYNSDTGYFEGTLQWTADNGGKFRIVELEAADGYEGQWTGDVDLSEKLNWVFDDVSDDHTDYSGKVTNEDNSFTINKVDEYSGKPIAGIRFRFWSDDASVKEFTKDTDTAGQITVTGLKNKTTYHYQEVEGGTNKDYLLDTTVHSFDVDEHGYVNGEAHYAETIKNTPLNALGRVLISKVDLDTNDPIENVSFKVYEWNKYTGAYETLPYAEITSDQYNKTTGMYEYEYLKYSDDNEGKFKIEETDRPINYLGEWSKEVQFSLDGTGVHTFGDLTRDDGQKAIKVENYPITIKTTATDDITEDHMNVPNPESTITDTVAFHNLEWGKTYTVKGQMMDQETGDEFTDTAGNTIKGETQFRISDDGKSVEVLKTTAQGEAAGTTAVGKVTSTTQNSTVPGGVSDGTITVHFGLDTSEQGGRITVIYERLYDADGNLVTKHEDSNDDDQIINIIVPELHTTLVDDTVTKDGNEQKGTKDHIGQVTENESLRDTVYIQGMSSRLDYVLDGTLVYKYDYTEEDGTKHKAGETVIDGSGNPVTATKTFKAVEGTLVHADGEYLDANGDHVKALTKGAGYVNINFDLSSTNLENAVVVAYEKLSLINSKGEKVELTTHNDLTDADQSVYYPRVRTSAISNNTNSQVGTKDGAQSITDTVELKGLKKATPVYAEDGTTITGYTDTVYTITARLMSRTDGGKQIVDTEGNPVTVTDTLAVDKDGNITSKNGNPITQTAGANAEVVNGTVKLTVTVPGEDVEGVTTVMFENLYHRDTDVARHNDINDESQTVRHPFFVKLMTGGGGIAGIFGIGVLAALIAAIAYTRRKRKIA